MMGNMIAHFIRLVLDIKKAPRPRSQEAFLLAFLLTAPLRVPITTLLFSGQLVPEFEGYFE
jgi:hypothetical protein